MMKEHVAHTSPAAGQPAAGVTDHRLDSRPIRFLDQLRSAEDPGQAMEAAIGVVSKAIYTPRDLLLPIAILVGTPIFFSLLFIIPWIFVRDLTLLICGLFFIGLAFVTFFGIVLRSMILPSKDYKRMLKVLNDGRAKLFLDRVERISVNKKDPKKLEILFHHAGRFLLGDTFPATSIATLQQELSGGVLLLFPEGETTPIVLRICPEEEPEEPAAEASPDRQVDVLAREQFGGDVTAAIRYAMEQYDTWALSRLCKELQEGAERDAAYRILTETFDARYPGGMAATEAEDYLENEYGVTRAEARKPHPFPQQGAWLRAALLLPVIIAGIVLLSLYIYESGVGVLPAVLLAVMLLLAAYMIFELSDKSSKRKKYRKAKQVFSSETYRQQLDAIPERELVRLERIAELHRTVKQRNDPDVRFALIEDRY